MKRGIEGLKPPNDLKDNSDTLKFLSQGLKLAPSPEEGNIIQQIESKVKEIEEDLFTESMQAIQSFYDSVTERDIDGKETRNWNNLTGQDCEEVLWALNYELIRANDEVSKLYNLAQFGYNVWDDIYYEAYSKPVEGTQNDRTAYAKKRTKEERYYYMYCYWVHKRVKDKLDSIKQIKRDIEQTLQRRVSDRNRVYE